MSVPPLFSNFGKSTNDLFKKKFDLDPIQFKTINKAKNGLTVESGGVNTIPKSGPPAYLRGYTKLSLSAPAWGSADLEVHTDVEQTSKLSAKFSKIYPGFVCQVAMASKDKAEMFKASKYVGVGEGTYSQSGVQASVKATSDFATKSKADLSASLSYENWSLGTQITLDTDHSLLSIQEPHLGGEYTQDDLTLSLFSSLEKAVRYVNASYFQRVSRDLVTGASFKIPYADPKSTTVTIGSDYRVDANTGLRAKIELPTGAAAVSVEQRLETPAQCLIGLASEFNVSNPANIVPGKFGFSFTFGDF